MNFVTVQIRRFSSGFLGEIMLGGEKPERQLNPKFQANSAKAQRTGKSNLLGRPENYRVSTPIGYRTNQ